MRNIVKYSAALLLAGAVLSGCKKFSEPEPYEFARMEANMTLADFKAKYAGGPTEITESDIILEGKIISSDRSGNIYRTLYIEDSTAGLEVKIGKTGLYNDYKLGQTLYIKPQGLCLGAYGGSVQLGAKSYSDRYETTWLDVQALIDRTIFRGEFGDPLPPADITDAAQITDAMVCRYVRLVGFSYQGSPDGLHTWAVSNDPYTGREADYGEQNFSLGDVTVVVRSSGYSSFADTEVGLEIGTKCNLTGILTKYNDTYQLVLLDLDGVEVVSEQ
ncbi:MAG TPA: hypothetical protein IAC03_07405 [Candidatus Coprenecus pullistercoris]|nr:hypothetical protein [Candidatus Coprenecus pullistercoris]